MIVDFVIEHKMPEGSNVVLIIPGDVGIESERLECLSYSRSGRSTFELECDFYEYNNIVINLIE